TVDLEAVGAIERGELQRLAENARLAKDHVAGPGFGAIRVGAGGPDEQVGKAVAIDIARRAHAEPRVVASRYAVDLEAVGAIERGEIQRLGEAARLAKDHVAGPGEGDIRGG